MELSKFIQSESDIMPKCLESLLHHSKLLGHARHIVDMNGLPLLMEIYHRNKKNIDITIKLCEMLAQMSYDKSMLEPLYKSGNFPSGVKYTFYYDNSRSFCLQPAFAVLIYPKKCFHVCIL